MFERRGELLVHENITVVPSIHGRAVFALEVRRRFLEDHYDCVAVELPPSVEDKVLEAVDELPDIQVVVYREPGGGFVYIPMDPCDSIVEAVRLGMRELRCELAFVDAEVAELAAPGVALPDEFAATRLGVPRYYETVAAHLPETPVGTVDDLREQMMAWRLQELAKAHEKVLFVCGIQHVRGVGRYLDLGLRGEPRDGAPPNLVFTQPLHEDSLARVLGELPFNTWLYNEIRHSITLDEYEPIFGLKHLLMTTRERVHSRFKDDIHRITPLALNQMLQYMRNLSLLGGYLTPSLYDIAVAAKGIGGDAFAIELLEVARTYDDVPPVVEDEEEDDEGEVDELDDEDFEEGDEAEDEDESPSYPWEDPSPPWASPTYNFEEATPEAAYELGEMQMTERQALINGQVEPVKPRLPGVPKVFRRLKLEKRPTPKMRKSWKRAWDDRRAVSWPPEDEIIEGFADYVRKRALKMTSLSLTRAEEFSSSLMDGLHVKETLRHAHLNKLYVKVEPRVTGNVGAVVVIFEEDLEDGRFPWKITWYAEHENESTLAFYATPFQDNHIGPGIARSLYGGALFLYPPKTIPDVWEDRRFEKARTSMERLVFAAALHSDDKFIAYVAPKPPSKRMRDFCDLIGRRLIYLPLASFSRGTLWKMRAFHVLNGRQVRSWAARYIR